MPTDKPSKLKQNKITKKLSLVNKGIDLTAYTPINIYITSDEQAKQGDWGYIPFQGGDVKLVGKYFADDWKKIILTTDQDLIKDGVQDIDDEFLEWYVQNPSCEYVDQKLVWVAQKFNSIYKIIIPSIGINSLNKQD